METNVNMGKKLFWEIQFASQLVGCRTATRSWTRSDDVAEAEEDGAHDAVEVFIVSVKARWPETQRSIR